MICWPSPRRQVDDLQALLQESGGDMSSGYKDISNAFSTNTSEVRHAEQFIADIKMQLEQVQ